MITRLLFITVILSLASCTAIKTQQLMKSGEIGQSNFNVNVPFTYEYGLIFIPVVIDGQEYKFMLDTGAPNVITKELATSLGVEIVMNNKVSDSQGASSNLEFAKIDSLHIADLLFLNTGTAIADFSQSKEMGCMKIDGIIGANLMRNGIWKIDYSKQVLTVTNAISSLSIPDSVAQIPFQENISGSPLVNVSLDGLTLKNVLFDTGSNGDISLSKYTYGVVSKKEAQLNQEIFFGHSSSGIYGAGEMDSIYYVNSKEVVIGDVRVKNYTSKFSGKKQTLGNLFFDKYDVVIDWSTKMITMIKNNEEHNPSKETFGFSCREEEGKLTIVQLYSEVGDLKVGDHIVKIGDKDYKTITPDQSCQLLFEGPASKDLEEVEVTVLRDGKEMSFMIKKHLLFSEMLK